MSAPQASGSQAKRVFKETVDIYRNDLNSILKNPIPFLLTLGGLFAFWLAVKWL